MYKYLVIVLFIFPLPLLAQVKTIGTPQIHNYLKSDYNAGTQNWAISQDKKGFMYFANNDGLLRFDGFLWELFTVPHSSPLRTIHIDSQDRIFVGMFNDMGIMQPDKAGGLVFHSLRSLLPDPDIEFDDIWKIHEIQQGIVFQSFDYLFILKDEKLEVIKPRNQFHFSFNVNGRLFLHEPGAGLFEYINGSIQHVPWAGELNNKEIWTILNIRENDLLIGTSRHGIYKFESGKLDKWDTPANNLLQEYKLFSAVQLADNYFAFGTITNGIVIAKGDGAVVQQISMNQGLQNNTVLSMYRDNNDNLWLGLDNGIDYVEINSPISYISESKRLGTGYAARIFNNKLYLGTNQGLFVKPFSEYSGVSENFQLIENTTGQVWSLNVIDNQLICGHNLGTFIIENNLAKQISQEEGGWTYMPVMNHPDIVLGGHYTGLQLFGKVDGKWQFLKNVKGFQESSRYLEQDENGTIWMSHGGKGIYKIQLNNALDSVKEYTVYTSKNGLPSDEQNIIIKFKNEIYASTINGLYEYDQENDRFVISDELNQLFNLEGRLKTLKTDSEDNIWFIAENESGVFRINDDLTYTKITSPFKQLDSRYVNEFELVYPYNNDNVFFGIDYGFAHYSSKFIKSYAQPFQSFITRVEIPYLDSTIRVNEVTSDFEYRFPFQKNAFVFHFTAPFYENQDNILFSFLLDNYSGEWSEWAPGIQKEYTNLPEGRYTFRLKALNLYGVESTVSTFDFEISPPWHRSAIAYYAYIILFFLITALIVKFVLFRLKTVQKRQEKKYQEEMVTKEEQFKHQVLIAEKEIIRLQNEKLQNDMIYRDKELANQTMGIIHKNKFLLKLQNELQQAQKSTHDSDLKKNLSTLSRRIKKEIDNKQQNQIFEVYFDEVHEEFFKKLKERYPDLSPREMRMCAYIRMNLTSKEMAALLNISERGVEIGRYRLRKKLNLQRDTNFSIFLSNI